MEPTVTLGVTLAFTAGLLSFLSPCVLPLIPSYLTFVTGMDLDEVQRSRRTTLLHALLFVIGFSAVFLLLGATASALGRLFFAYREWLSRIGGVLLVVFALYLLGIVRMGALDRDRRVHLANKPLGLLGTVFVGAAFAAGWSPCIGPILGGILSYTATEADFGRGLRLLGAYSAGLAVPFLLSAVAVEQFLGALKRHRARVQWVNRIAGVLLLVVGLLLLSGQLTVLTRMLQQATPDFLRARL
ncbi:MAG: cytochrome c biosis protein transrane region [Gemmatimonadetes bacterium]|nr:cytochrome c biosis protein transrane region [Gemmatimonadota bacterium]